MIRSHSAARLLKAHGRPAGQPGSGPPAPDAQHPKFEMVVTVPSEFNENPGNSAIIHCTVRDSFGATGGADITITVN